MNENIDRHYFSFVKFIGIIFFYILFIMTENVELPKIGYGIFLMSCILAMEVFFEVTNHFKKCILVSQIILVILMILNYPSFGLFVLPMLILDWVTYFNRSIPYYLLAYVGILLYKGDVFLYTIIVSFFILIYFQNFYIIDKYRRYIANYEKEETRLKDYIDTKDLLFRKELEQNSLIFENKMLEEKARLSQALHDKLGHSINGSIYQLEAGKVIATKNPDQSIGMIQGVIDNLRTSMDEIRAILRREKPDKKRMALLQLTGLCEDCKEKYGIHGEVILEGEKITVPEVIWEIILDNTFEAVSNALKYSKCTEIIIKISILHKIVRCSIKDNGVGCYSIKEGMGIQGMKQRVRGVNGVIDLESSNGFRINMILPF